MTQLNELPGSAFSEEVGGGRVSQPYGVIHVGDIVDNGDKGPSKFRMAETETAAFLADWGLNGNEGRLNVPDEKVIHNEWDYGDAQAYYETIKPYNVAATLCGHTHSRKIAHWNGTKDDRVTDGVPFLNTDNAAHFDKPAQAFLHVEIDAREMRVREYSTIDGWRTGTWTPQIWRFLLHV